MPANNLQRIRPTQMPQRAEVMLGALNGPQGGDYPITALQRDRLVRAERELIEANEALTLAETAYRAAVTRRQEAHAACGDAMASVARVVYAADVEPGQVAAAGLSPHKEGRSRVVPRKVEGLVASPSAVGEVTLVFERSANAREVVFLVEAQIGSEPWAVVECGTRTRYVLRGFTPGVPASFRVVASKGGRRSAPSNLASVYTESGALRLAA